MSELTDELVFKKPVRIENGQSSYYQFEQVNDKTAYTIETTYENGLIQLPIIPLDIENIVLESFIQFAAGFFVKAPTIEQHKKHLQHTVIENSSQKAADKSLVIGAVLYPKIVCIYSKKTEIQWLVLRHILSDSERIPSDFLVVSRPASPVEDPLMKNIVLTSDPVQNAIMEAVGDIPLQEDSSRNPLRLMDDSEERMYRLRVLESRLSAKLAKYKMKKELDKYYSRFGRMPPPDDEDLEDEDGEDSEYYDEDEIPEH
uniref:Uncharacterized protein n=1 Tax=viral metagenome TaxID=1070528 RepID=A0A6C0I9V2_9ZZZZ